MDVAMCGQGLSLEAQCATRTRDKDLQIPVFQGTSDGQVSTYL